MHDRQRLQPSAPARVLAVGGLVLAAALVALALTRASQPYRIRLIFSDASGLVSGDQVLVGPAVVGTVQSLALTNRGRAAVVVALDPRAGPLYRGTVARIEAGGLAGIANHYVTLQPAAASGNTVIPDGGTISPPDTHAEVGLDQVLNALGPQTRQGLRNVIQGGAAGIQGKAQQANRTLAYLDPFLQSTSRFTAALTRDEPAFDQLLVRGAQTMGSLASRSNQLTDLVGQADTVMSTVARRSRSLAQTLSLLPPTLSRSTRTLDGLRATLATLRPLVVAAKPQVRQLTPFAVALRRFASSARPTLARLATLISSPSGSDLTSLLLEAPALELASRGGFPAIIASLSAQESSGQLAALRAYTPDIVAALANTGALSGYYDANGHYGRAEPFYGAYGVSGGTLTDQSPAYRYRGLTVVRTGRCPGGATQPAGPSMPLQVNGCQTSNTPAGP